jgi:hypothetical protein
MTCFFLKKPQLKIFTELQAGSILGKVGNKKFNFTQNKAKWRYNFLLPLEG